MGKFGFFSPCKGGDLPTGRQVSRPRTEGHRTKIPFLIFSSCKGGDVRPRTKRVYANRFPPSLYPHPEPLRFANSPPPLYRGGKNTTSLLTLPLSKYSCERSFCRVPDPRLRGDDIKNQCNLASYPLPKRCSSAKYEK